MTEDDVPRTIAAVPIAEVTVQEDRALVRREGTITAPPGRSRLRIEGVAPVLVDKSITAEVLASGAGEVEGVRVLGVVATRWHVTEQAQRPAALAELQTTLRQRQAEHQALTRRRGSVVAEREVVEAILRATLVELGQDAGWGRTDPAHLHGTLDVLEERLAVLGRERRELEAEHERQVRDLADLHQLEAAAHTVQARTAAALELELHNPGDEARELRLRVDYLVPGALWRPWHRARLIEAEGGGAARIELRCEGCVWQATGEDWDDVQLVFSTERPSLGLVPPVLHTDVLALRKKGPAVEAQARQEQIHTAGLGSDEGGPTAAPELPGIDDGGEAQRLRGRGRCSIPGDGRPYRVPLFDVEGPADVELRCVPELAPVVLLRTEQANNAPHPLLAGPVDLVRRSGLVGRTSLLYVAPGERFELGWGPDNGVRVTRELEQPAHVRKALSAWTHKPRKVRVKLSSLDATPRTLQVRERIAVSELDKVKVELQSASPAAKPDADGILRWDVHLPGFGRKELVLEWELVVHDDVQGV